MSEMSDTAADHRKFYDENWRQFEKPVRKKKFLTDLAVKAVHLVKNPAILKRITVFKAQHLSDKQRMRLMIALANNDEAVLREFGFKFPKRPKEKEPFGNARSDDRPRGGKMSKSLEEVKAAYAALSDEGKGEVVRALTERDPLKKALGDDALAERVWKTLNTPAHTVSF